MKMTKEEKEKLGISKYAAIKAVVKLNQEGEIIEHYFSLKNAAEKNGLNPKTLCNALKQREGRLKGMWFQYAHQKSNFQMPEKKCRFRHIQHLPYGGLYKREARNE